MKSTLPLSDKIKYVIFTVNHTAYQEYSLNDSFLNRFFALLSGEL
jgi:hypothetical protein